MESEVLSRLKVCNSVWTARSGKIEASDEQTGGVTPNNDAKGSDPR